MTEPQFKNELWIRCYMDQIDGYPLGHTKRTGFKPIVPFIPNDREKTLAMSVYAGKFTPEQRVLLLDETVSERD